MIHFKLRHIDEAQPAGTEGDLHMSWFWLTDGELWIDLSGSTLFEYTPEALAHFGEAKSAYNDYPIVRFMEDFTALFRPISESLPDDIYALTEDVQGFLNHAQKWLDMQDEDVHSDFYFEAYDPLISWSYLKALDSGHLIGGPHFWFFRNRDKIRMVWDTEFQLDNGIDLWTAKNGSTEIPYASFLAIVKDFGERFFAQMEEQVQSAILKDWGEINLDKVRLVKEQRERASAFWEQFALLKSDPPSETNWQQIRELKSQMEKDFKTKKP